MIIAAALLSLVPVSQEWLRPDEFHLWGTYSDGSGSIDHRSKATSFDTSSDGVWGLGAGFTWYIGPRCDYNAGIERALDRMSSVLLDIQDPSVSASASASASALAGAASEAESLNTVLPVVYPVTCPPDESAPPPQDPPLGGGEGGGVGGTFLEKLLGSLLTIVVAAVVAWVNRERIPVVKTLIARRNKDDSC